jgi:hypothetical protein
MYTFGAYVGSVLNIVTERPLNLFKNNGAFSFAKKLERFSELELLKTE